MWQQYWLFWRVSVTSMITSHQLVLDLCDSITPLNSNVQLEILNLNFPVTPISNMHQLALQSKAHI